MNKNILGSINLNVTHTYRTEPGKEECGENVSRQDGSPARRRVAARLMRYARYSGRQAGSA